MRPESKSDVRVDFDGPATCDRQFDLKGHL
jgi:hypothetical protein